MWIIAWKFEDIIPLTVAQLGDYEEYFKPVITGILELSKDKKVSVKLKDKIMQQVSSFLSLALAYKSHNDDILKNYDKDKAWIKKNHMDWKVHEDKIRFALDWVRSELETLKAVVGD